MFGINHELKDSHGLTAFDIAKGKDDSSVITEIRNAIEMFSTIHRGKILYTLIFMTIFVPLYDSPIIYYDYFYYYYSFYFVFYVF